MDWEQIALTASVWLLPVLIAVTLHEASHGWVAWKLGDDTAYRMGRVTFNPLKHIDPFGTVLLPAMMLIGSGGSMMFGFAKPVPVAFHRLRKARRDMVLVAMAGPASNILLATISILLMHTLPVFEGALQEWIAKNLFNSAWINILLAVFNMLPLPPLDGGRVAVGVLPRFLGYQLARLEKFGFFIILGVVFVVPWIGDKMGMDLNVFWSLVGVPAQKILSTLLYVLGVG